MNKLLNAFAAVLLAQAIGNATVKGNVLDSLTHLPISGAKAQLVTAGTNSLSDSKGYFSLPTEPTGTRSETNAASDLSFQLNDTRLTYSIPQSYSNSLTINVSDVTGRSTKLFTGKATQGNYSLDLAQKIHDPGTYILQISYGNQQFYRVFSLAHTTSSGMVANTSTVNRSQRALRLVGSTYDTLVVSMANYVTKRISLVGADDSIPSILLSHISSSSSSKPSSSSITPSSSSLIPSSSSSKPSSSSSKPSSSSSKPSSSSITPSSASQEQADGYAMVNGTTTGGGTATPTTVTTLAALKAAASDANPRVIIVDGTINAVDPVTIKSNKTIIGKNASAKIYGGILMDGVSNVIVRNLKIQGVYPNAGAGDAVAVKNKAHHIWLDHLEVWDAPDGQMDITLQASYVTVSWCKFWYTSTSNPHRLNGLIGAGGGTVPADFGNLKVTYHHNWFSTNVDQRMPRLMYGMAHIYNNYYFSPGNLYCIGVGSYGAALVENNYFKEVNNPINFMYDVYASITERNNVFDKTTGTKDSGMLGTTDASGQSFNVVALTTVPYTYVLDKASDIPMLVVQNAGPK